MKIGYFVTHYPYKKDYDDYFCGGVGVVAENLAKEMRERGHEVLIFTTSRTKKFCFEETGGIKIYRYGADLRIAEAYMSFRLLFCPLRHEMDIVHAHAGNPPAPISAYWYAKKKRKPFIVTYHGDGQWNWGGFIRRISVYFYNKHLLDKVLSYADIILSPSERHINESQFLGSYRNKIVVIPNGINLNNFDVPYSKEECRKMFGLTSEDKIILFLGTLGPHKGPDVLLKAMPKIIKEIRDVKLAFAGAGPLKEELIRQSKKLGIERNAIFAGFVEESSKPFYYRAADIFCFPSVMKHEIFGIVNLEAMACGIPIVASKIGGVPDVVKDGENGLLVPPGDSDALAEAIIYLLENEEVRESLGKNGRKKVDNYSWERIAAETEKLYERITS